MLEGLVSAAQKSDAEQPTIRTRPQGRIPGAVGALSQSVTNMVAELENAQKTIAAGDVIVELDVSLIDSSIVADRLNIGDDPETADFIESIRRHGQKTPILVRPHPTAEGRYQVAYGHRRLHALRTIGRPVKAQIVPMTDEELVIAQGQENRSRLDLSYIERCMFAQRLEDRSFKRDTIIEALRVDKTELSRMLRVSRGIPHELIYKIGPAATVGRRRWGDLVDAISSIDWGREGGSIMEAADRPDITSDDRFAVVLAVALERVQPTAPAGSTPQSTPGRQQGRGPELTTVDQAEPPMQSLRPDSGRPEAANGRTAEELLPIHERDSVKIIPGPGEIRIVYNQEEFSTPEIQAFIASIRTASFELKRKSG